MIQVLIADDQALIRSGFKMILESEDDIEVVAEAADGAEAERLAAEHRPDVVLMDVRMPNMDGVEATRRVVSGGYSRVLILTTFDLDEYLFDGIRAGASGFLLKDVPPDDLVEAVRAVARGDGLVEPRMTRRLLTEFAAHPERPGGKEAERVAELLTDRELEVFTEVAKGCTNAEIAEALFISETTVKTHVAHILMKLDLRDRIQAVVLAYESGMLPA
ncbi:MAG: response regulator transcription factor [Actinobacteria bacterium]|nr:response regulator transcription factor [Actinomycetota bacterium]